MTTDLTSESPNIAQNSVLKLSSTLKEEIEHNAHVTEEKL